ncbi:energy-coupling factor transporter transmembrane protein EcfT [Candidatus Woesearchaeota archaeon]|nr:energy-coupling factor transporter transmembrane protein EcfT [Candidatus Woesearchaeota archaeon]
MIKALAFGQYRFKNSLVHKLDSRVKLLFVVILSILIFLINDGKRSLFFSLFILVVVLLSKIEFKNILNNLKPFYLMLVFIFLMYLIFSRNKLAQGFIAIWRFLMLIIMSFVLTYTTTISSLIAAVESLAKPLKFFRVKPRNAALMISIAIRFVPVMFINLSRAREAMASRLADFRKFRHIKLMIFSLLGRMLKSASALSDALHSRLYNENAENHKILRLSRYDYLSLLVFIVFVFVIY